MANIRFKCDLCQMYFNSFLSLDKHFFKHKFGPESNYGVKGRRFRRQTAKTFECDLCRKQYWTKHSLGNHLQRHTNGTILNYNIKTDSARKKEYKQSKYRPRHKPISAIEKDIRDNGMIFKTDLIGSDIYSTKKDSMNFSEGFQCNVCGRTFLLYQGLLSHHHQKHMTPKYTCDICGMSYTLKKTFQIHLANHINGSRDSHSFVQTESIGISDNGQLNSYITALKQRPGRVYKCTDCNSSFTSFNILANHVLLHTGLLSYTCHMCCCKFQTRKKYVLHMEEHFLMFHKHFAFKCSICPCSFSKSHYLNEHERWHKSNKPLFCTKCQCQFSSVSEQISHMKQHLEHHPDKHYCDICTRSDITTGSLLVHYYTHVNGLKDKCAVCGMAFSENENRRSTIRTYHYQSHVEEDLLCDICGAHFTSHQRLQNHKRRHWQKTYKIVCPICQKTFSSGAFYLHKMMHTGNKSSVCHVCGKAFLLPHHLKDHMRIHTKDRPFKCQSCNSSFKVLSHLKQHIGTVRCMQLTNSLNKVVVTKKEEIVD